SPGIPVYLAKIVKAAKRDIPIPLEWQRPHIRRISWRQIAPVTFEPYRFLAVRGFITAGRVEKTIGQTEVNGVESGGAAISEISCLNRCRFPREYQEPVAFHMHRQIDKYVDAIPKNQVCK